MAPDTACALTGASAAGRNAPAALQPQLEAPVNAHAVSGATGTALAFAVTTALKG